MKFKLKDDRAIPCYFCKTDKSVKYIGILKETNKEISICNKCVIIENDKLKEIDNERF